MLFEIQARLGPRARHARACGVPCCFWDPSAPVMVLAVLEARFGRALGWGDVYLNVLRCLADREPAADLDGGRRPGTPSRPRPAGSPPALVVFVEIGLLARFAPSAKSPSNS